jgi:hypothetical protein
MHFLMKRWRKTTHPTAMREVELLFPPDVQDAPGLELKQVFPRGLDTVML